MTVDPRPPFDGVVYQIYPRSFRDTDGDGIGDLAGVVQGLDHLAWLGVDALWLSPIFRSPMADMGYDVADYCDVDPLFGALEDADRLIEEAHTRGLEVWLDWVPNHTSDQHPWFQASRSSRDDPKRDWYIWRDPAPDGGPPNNWRRDWVDEPAWTFDETTAQYYLHCFLPQQPDLNWANPEVRAAMLDTLRFWIRRGVDGFRADVVHLIGKDPTLPDAPADRAHLARPLVHDDPVTHEYLREIRSALDEHEVRMVGEVNLPDPHRVASYVGPDQLPLAFYFGLIYSPWDARAWSRTIERANQAFGGSGGSPAWALGNHDQARQRTRFGGSESRARTAALVLLALRGVPFLYAGEELGLEDADVPPSRQVDPGGRDGCRAPIPWTAEDGHGWPADPWLPWPPQAKARSVEIQRDDPDSVLHLYRSLLAARRASPALRQGRQVVSQPADQVLELRRTTDDDERLVLANFSDEPQLVELDGSWTVVACSEQGTEGEPFYGRLEAEHAVLLAPVPAG